MNKNKSIGTTYFLLVVCFAFYLFLLPPFEGPDECFHLYKIYDTDDFGLYYSTVRSVMQYVYQFAPFGGLSNPCDFLRENLYFKFLSDGLLYGTTEMPTTYIYLKVVNLLLFAFTLYGLCDKVLFPNKIFLFPVVIAAFIWPAIVSRLSDVSSDFFSIIYAILAALLFFDKRYIQLFAFGILGIVFDDNSYLITIFFYIILIITLRLKPRIFAVFGTLVLIPTLIIPLAFQFLGALNLPFAEAIINFHNANLEFATNPLIRLGTLFSSLYYVGGNFSITGFYFEYFLFFVLLLCLFVYDRSPFYFRYAFFALIVSFLVLTSFVQPMTHARYYFAFVPFITVSIYNTFGRSEGPYKFSFRLISLFFLLNMLHLVIFNNIYLS